MRARARALQRGSLWPNAHAARAQVQTPMARLRKVATLLAVGLTAIHLGMWVLTFIQLDIQISLVNDLS